jgi:hypothetical protein
MPHDLDVSLSNKDIQNVVSEVDKGKIVLPDFQRDFVWPTKQIAKLLESILNGYYIDTLLTLPVAGGNDNIPFPPRSVAGSEENGTANNVEMVLDGQQRISSIYYALKAPQLSLDNTKYPHLFCFKFSKIVNGEFDEDAINHRRRDWDSSQELIDNNYEVQVEKDLIPCTVFKSSQAFDEWRFGFYDYAESHEEVDREDIQEFEKRTQIFRNYDIPIIEMDADTPDTTVVQTFERINTQGMDLGVFDILTARLYPHMSISLRDLWEETITQYPRIETYADNTGKERVRERLLRVLALYRGEECTESSLRELEPENFPDDWRTAASMLDRCLEKARSSDRGGFGVTEKYGFPYGSIVPALANLIYLAEEKGSYPDQRGLEKIQQWYWTSIFSTRYSGSSDTISYRDYNQMKEWIHEDSDEIPEAIEEGARRIPIEIDLETTTRGGPYDGVMSLLVLNGARDFGTFESITVHQVDDHHIFPKTQLENGLNGNEYSETERNRILNRTIIQYRNNRFKYGDDLPSNYVQDMVNEHPEGEEGVKELLQQHFINEEGFKALLRDDYETFCQARKKEIREEIEDRVGKEIDWSMSEAEI